MSVENFSENKNYKIVSIKEVQTKFGKSYIMTDNNCNKYWSNKKIADFIKRNNIKPSNDDSKILFNIKTFEYKTFKNSDGEEIRFLEMRVHF